MPGSKEIAETSQSRETASLSSRQVCKFCIQILRSHAVAVKCWRKHHAWLQNVHQLLEELVCYHAWAHQNSRWILHWKMDILY